MAMVVNHNIPALSTYNVVNQTNNALNKSIQKLSTGLRINSAADDAAGLAISEKMRSQVNGMDRAVSNAQDGISMIQTAEGALNETHSILQRMRELSVQAANDTLTSQDRSYIQMEIDELRDEVTRIGNTTQFNKKKLLNGDAAVLWSSDKLSTKAIVNGGLRSIDQFGQKVVTEGNYEISIKAKPGQAEVQKTDIFKIKHENVLMNVSTTKAAGVESVAVEGLPAGTYTVKAEATPSNQSAATVTGQYGFDEKTLGSIELTSSNTLADAPSPLTAAAQADPTNSAYYAGKDLTFKIGTMTATVQGSKITDTDAATAAALASKIQSELRAAGGAFANVTVTNDSGKLKIKADKILDDQTITLADGYTRQLFGDSPTMTDWTAGSNKLTLDQQLAVTPNDLNKNANILIEVTDVNANAKTITVKATGSFLDVNGKLSNVTEEDIVLAEGTDTYLFKGQLGDTALKFVLQADMTDTFKKGNKVAYSIAAGSTAAGDVGVKVDGTPNANWEENWGKVLDNSIEYSLKADNVKNKDIHLQNYYINSKNGKVYEGDIILSTNSNAIPAEDKALASFEKAFVGQVAKEDVKLRDLDKFWTSEGVFMLEDPQTITITQGNGDSASFTISGNDTLGDVQKKLNDAIGIGLGQAQYVDNADHFAQFVGDNADSGPESVAGTFVIRSVVPGASGELSFSAGEDVLNALSLNNIRKATESNYTVSIKDAHSGTSIVSNEKVTGNKLVGLVNPNVDVEFDSLTGVTARWDSSTKSYVYNEPTVGKTILHLADNTTVFQVGANEGEDMGIHIGDMRANALGIDKVLVTDRDSASRSITILDNAIDKVSTQRAKLGAYQNRLEHTINNLNTASENITAAESRIRDTDMAKEMMNFTKLQIMLQAGNSMLAQANQLPQNVMSLIR